MAKFQSQTGGMQNKHKGITNAINNLKETIALRSYGKTAYQSNLYHCKYSMHIYTVKIHLYFNMYCMIWNLHKEMNVTCQNSCIFVEFSPIPRKQL